MDGTRTESPVYARQWSNESSSTGTSSPAMSPVRYHHARSSSLATGMSNIKRTQNVAAKAAAQRLAQVMASQTADDDDEDEDDELGFRYSAPPPPSFTRNRPAIPTSTRFTRSPSPALARNFVEEPTSVRSTSAGRPSMSPRAVPPAVAPRNFVEERTSVRSTSTGRPSMSPRAVPPAMPPSRGSLRTAVSLPPPIEPPRQKEKRFLSGTGHLNVKDNGDQREASALRDELDMLQEENENIHDKLRVEEQKREEADARVRELEKQIAALGEGVSLEAKLLSRKEASLRQREVIKEV